MRLDNKAEGEGEKTDSECDEETALDLTPNSKEK